MTAIIQQEILFLAKDIDDRHFEIVMTYYLSRGGDRNVSSGKCHSKVKIILGDINE